MLTLGRTARMTPAFFTGDVPVDYKVRIEVTKPQDTVSFDSNFVRPTGILQIEETSA